MAYRWQYSFTNQPVLVDENGVPVDVTRDKDRTQWGGYGESRAPDGTILHGTDGATADTQRYRQMAGNVPERAPIIDQTRSNEARGYGTEAMGLLEDAATGRTPSQAVLLGRRQTADAQNAQRSMAGTVRGGAAARAAAGRAATMNAATIGQQGALQEEATRAGEMANARGALFGAATTQRGQDLGLATDQAKLDAEQRSRNLQHEQFYERLGWETQNAQLGRNLGRKASEQAAANANRAQNLADDQASWGRTKDAIGMASGALTGGLNAAGATAPKEPPKQKSDWDDYMSSDEYLKSDERVKFGIMPLSPRSGPADALIFGGGPQAHSSIATQFARGAAAPTLLSDERTKSGFISILDREPAGQQLHQSRDGHAFYAGASESEPGGDGRASLSGPEPTFGRSKRKPEPEKKKAKAAPKKERDLGKEADALMASMRSEHDARMAQGPAVFGRDVTVSDDRAKLVAAERRAFTEGAAYATKQITGEEMQPWDDGGEEGDEGEDPYKDFVAPPGPNALPPPTPTRDPVAFERRRPAAMSKADEFRTRVQAQIREKNRTGTGPVVLDASRFRRKRDPISFERERPPAPSGSQKDEMESANRSMAPFSYQYKPGFTPPSQTPGERNVGPMAQNMAKDPVASSAVVQGPDGLLMIDKEKGLKLTMGGLASLQSQVDELKRKSSGNASRAPSGRKR